MNNPQNLPTEWWNCNDPILLQLCGPKWLREPGEEDDPKPSIEDRIAALGLKMTRRKNGDIDVQSDYYFEFSGPERDLEQFVATFEEVGPHCGMCGDPIDSDIRWCGNCREFL